MNSDIIFDKLKNGSVEEKIEVLEVIERIWDERKSPILYDGLINIYPLESDKKTKLFMIKLISKFNPTKAIHDLQVFYEQDSDIDIRTTIIRRLASISHPQMDDILYKLLSMESNEFLRQVIQKNITLYHKAMIEEKNDSSKFTYFKKINFTKEIADKSCMICKLDLHNNDDIFQCFVCKSYYHWEHLNQWLKKHDECPVCNRCIH